MAEVSLSPDAGRALREAENYCWRANVGIVAPERLLAGCIQVLNAAGFPGLPADEQVEQALLMAQGMSEDALTQNVMFGSTARDAVNFTARLVREAGGAKSTPSRSPTASSSPANSAPCSSVRWGPGRARSLKRSGNRKPLERWTRWGPTSNDEPRTAVVRTPVVPSRIFSPMRRRGPNHLHSRFVVPAVLGTKSSLWRLTNMHYSCPAPTTSSGLPPRAGGQGGGQVVHGPLEELTPREREVLELLKQRKTNAEIARILVITEDTVQRHVRNVLHKLGYRNRRELWDDMIG